MTVYVDNEIPPESRSDRKKRLAREATARYRARHPEKVKANEKLRYDADPQRAMDRHRRWRKKNTENPLVREKALAAARRSYAPRRERELIYITGGTRPEICDVCGGAGKICFDHCHASGVFRGWLCNACNLVLGHVKDSPQILRKLADYLDQTARST